MFLQAWLVWESVCLCEQVEVVQGFLITFNRIPFAENGYIWPIYFKQYTTSVLQIQIVSIGFLLRGTFHSLCIGIDLYFNKIMLFPHSYSTLDSFL